MQEVLERLQARKDAWAAAPPDRRVALLRQCLACTQGVAEAWTCTANEMRGLDPDGPLAGEEMINGPLVLMRLLRIMADSGEGSIPSLPARLAGSGRTVARIFPRTLPEKLMWLGYQGEVWIEPGRSAARRGPWRAESAPGRVALVLGAGNITSIAPADALHMLFAENAVVVLKLNPVTARLQSILEQALAPLVSEGFLTFVTGGAEEGAWLARHPLVDILHMTGSQQTHDALVWGGDPARAKPLISKPFTSELGCVTPVLVVPGPWSEADLAYQARHVAGMISHNAGFACAAAQVLVTDRKWPLRSAFLNRLRRELARMPARRAWYPGARERYADLVGRYPQAEALGRGNEEVLPWTLVPDVPAAEGEDALNREAFCGLLFESPVEAGGTAAYLDNAVDFVNEKVRGNLSCVVLVHPQTARDHARALDSAVERLRYGALGVNVWGGVIFGLMEFPWGAFPGNPMEDISSGRGFVHNAYGFEHPEKAVLRGPFRSLYLPPWFPGHGNLMGVGRALCAFEADPDWGEALHVVVESLKAGVLPGGL